MPDEITNSELARRLDSLQGAIPGYVLKEVYQSEQRLWESRHSELAKDISALEAEMDKLKEKLATAETKRIDDRRQYIKLFIGALLGGIVPTITLIVSLVQGVA